MSASNSLNKKVVYYPAMEDRKKKAQTSTRERLHIEELREELFSTIKHDCKDIPYWIPEPKQFKDWTPDKTIERINACRTLNQLETTSNEIRQDHFTQFTDDYKRHREIHDSTLEDTRAEYKRGERHGDLVKPLCCFNHYLGLTTKRGSTKILPIFDYELSLIHQLDSYHFVTYIASRGLGKTHSIVSTYSQWRIWRSTEWDDADVLLTTGLAQMNSTELLNKIEQRYSDAFPSLVLDFAGTELYVDKTRFIAFPTENIKRMRLFDKVAAIFVDEADFFNLRDQQRLQDAVRGYVLKSTPLIVFWSTPDHPNGFLIKCRKEWQRKKRGDNN